MRHALAAEPAVEAPRPTPQAAEEDRHAAVDWLGRDLDPTSAAKKDAQEPAGSGRRY
jgi:hypothetical protein